MFTGIKLIKRLFQPLNLVVLILLILLLVPTTIYFLNPYEVKSESIRPRVFGHDIYRIPSKSMLPTLRPGDYILISNKSYLQKTPTRGDVIVFETAQNQSKTPHRYIKRIVAIAGDELEIKNHQVLVNGKLLDEQYVEKNNNQSRYSKVMPEIKIPPNKVFVLGDNRDNSNDSRNFGLIDHDAIVGKAMFILFGKDSRQGEIK